MDEKKDKPKAPYFLDERYGRQMYHEVKQMYGMLQSHDETEFTIVTNFSNEIERVGCYKDEVNEKIVSLRPLRSLERYELRVTLRQIVD